MVAAADGGRIDDRSAHLDKPLLTAIVKCSGCHFHTIIVAEHWYIHVHSTSCRNFFARNLIRPQLKSFKHGKEHTEV